MKPKFKVRFSLIKNSKKDLTSGESQLYMVVCMNGERTSYYSDYRVHPKNFEKKKVEIGGSSSWIYKVKQNTFNTSGTPSSIINRRIETLQNAAIVVFEKYYSGGRENSFIAEDFKNYIAEELGEVKIKEEKAKDFITVNTETANAVEHEMFFYYQLYKDEKKVSDGRKRHYQSDINRLELYQGYLLNKLQEEAIKNGKDHRNITVNFTVENFNIYDYTKWLFESDMPRRVTSQKRCINTVVSIMKRLQAFYNYCVEKFKIIKNNPFNDIDFGEEIGKEKYNEPIIITRPEMDKLYAYNYDDERLSLIRDLFCLQSCIGCRVGDFMRMKYDYITFDESVNGTIHYYAYKTIDNQLELEKLDVPLSNRAREIIERWRGKTKDNHIMPFINHNDYNDGIREIARKAGLDRKVVVFSREKNREEVKILHEEMSSHMARRYFVDNLCQSGVDHRVVASMSGHSANSKAFERYTRKPKSQQEKAISKFMD